MKKVLIINLMLLFMGIIFTINTKISAEGLGQIDEIFDYQDYLDTPYDEYENEQYIGEYYKEGMWGHRMVAADLVTFCYNDMTFGNKIIGTYPLNVDIKEYD